LKKDIIVITIEGIIATHTAVAAARRKNKTPMAFLSLERYPPIK
jgi:hypothetical protein